MSMISRLVTRSVAAAASRQIAARVAHGGLGPLGNAAAMALPFVLSRVSPIGLVAVAAGAWAVGRMAQPATDPEPQMPMERAPMKRTPAERAPVVTPPPIAWSGPADY